jgi:HxlR-like helix-turn-helix
MQADGIIDRTDFREVPPKVEYAMTTFGTTLARSLVPLCEWGSLHQAEIEAIMGRRVAVPFGAGDAEHPETTRTVRDGSAAAEVSPHAFPDQPR